MSLRARRGWIARSARAAVAAGLAAALLPAAACARSSRTAYRLPGTALVPLASAGIEDRSAEYGALFCGVLAGEPGVGGPWGPCADYIEAPGPPRPDLPALAPGIRVLVIPGLLGQCFSPELQAFSDALAHLRDRHGVLAEYLDVPALGSCAHNAGIIAAHLRRRVTEQPGRYIVVGYSKGGCDLMTALVSYPEVREAVAALVTVAAPVGGSRLLDVTPGCMTRMLAMVKPGRCDKGDDGAVESLRRPVRQAFLRENPVPVVPTYSLVAVSDKAGTSRLLRSFWRKLARFSIDQDSQVIASEGIPPGARFLGVLRGDHWAIAMPFEHQKGFVMRKLVNRNHYPRFALLEAAVRLVAADLSNGPAAHGPRIPAAAPTVEVSSLRAPRAAGSHPRSRHRTVLP